MKALYSNQKQQSAGTNTVQNNLAKGRITVMSSFIMANAFIRRMRCAGIFTHSSR